MSTADQELENICCSTRTLAEFSTSLLVDLVQMSFIEGIGLWLQLLQILQLNFDTKRKSFKNHSVIFFFWEHLRESVLFQKLDSFASAWGSSEIIWGIEKQILIVWVFMLDDSQI